MSEDLQVYLHMQSDCNTSSPHRSLKVPRIWLIVDYRKCLKLENLYYRELLQESRLQLERLRDTVIPADLTYRYEDSDSLA